MIGSNVIIGGCFCLYNVLVIGNYVYIVIGVKVLGDIWVGDGVVIGVNVVVFEDVLFYSVVVGMFVKVIKININFKDFYWCLLVYFMLKY